MIDSINKYISLQNLEATDDGNDSMHKAQWILIRRETNYNSIISRVVKHVCITRKPYHNCSFYEIQYTYTSTFQSMWLIHPHHNMHTMYGFLYSMHTHQHMSHWSDSPKSHIGQIGPHKINAMTDHAYSCTRPNSSDLTALRVKVKEDILHRLTEQYCLRLFHNGPCNHMQPHGLHWHF